MASDRAFLEAAYKQLREVLSSRDDATLPSPSALQAASAALPQTSDPDYLTRRGPDAAVTHILDTVVPALNGQNLSGRYYGFVTGSALPVAEAADNVVSALDQNVQVHLPAQTASTAVEDAALRMLVDVLGLGPHDAWPGRTFTTGATASNVLGLACGREAVVASRLRKLGREGNASVGEAGLLAACQAAGVREIQVLTSMAHSSLSKAASVVGLGRASVKEVGVSRDEPWRLDLGAIEKLLQREGVASIIAVSAGEVNTGRFATKGEAEMRRLRTLADKYSAWVHVDGAFGIFARALPRSREFSRLHELTAGLELADSITVDGHKLLNVPYDAGVFFCRDAFVQTNVFTNPNAAYLSSVGGSQIFSPLNIGLENSRRFRALPVYATLVSEGRDGIAEMLARMVIMARKIVEFIIHSDAYELLPDETASLEEVHIVILFRARDDAINDSLVQKINDTRKMYVSGTKWKGKSACRIAVSSWKVQVENDLAVVKEVLTSIAGGRS
ncbi:Pyridoxal-dependent decarboxylase [Pleurostoma richardsiae]|uniref:Pyridoxal-dependent decarboxylase n=1 Tax=Pleurostoma richardsiae TaxID=41990 RepID=A0AA38RL36_9PEZI|nr:Pyridoxal-dependent decarboxylase [Pleurostoma richardsiae]